MLTATPPAHSVKPPPTAEPMRIAGERVAGARTLDVRNPYTNEVVATVPRASVDDIRRAFAIARAYKPRLTRYERSEICRNAAQIIQSRAEALSDLITAECGICKKDSLYEVGRARDVFSFAGNAVYKRQVLELGGNDPIIVMEDADLDEAATLAATGSYKNSGQRCTAVKRILVHEDVADAFVERLLMRTRAWTYGDPADPAVDMGTVIDEAAATAFESKVRGAVAQGARLLYGN